MKSLKIFLIMFVILYFINLSFSFSIFKKDLIYDIDVLNNICYVKEIVNYRLEKKDLLSLNEIKLKKVFPEIYSSQIKSIREKDNINTNKNLNFRNLKMDIEILMNKKNIDLNNYLTKIEREFLKNDNDFNFDKYFNNTKISLQNNISQKNNSEELYVYDIYLNDKNDSITKNLTKKSFNDGDVIKISFDYEINNYFTIMNNSKLIENYNKQEIKINNKNEILKIKPFSNNYEESKKIFDLESNIYFIPEKFETYSDNNNMIIYLRNYRKELTHSDIEFKDISIFDFDILKAIQKKESKNNLLKKRNLEYSSNFNEINPINYKIKIKANDLFKEINKKEELRFDPQGKKKLILILVI